MRTLSFRNFFIPCVGCVLLALSGGCRNQGVDPYENVNRALYGFNDALDRAVLEPATDVYEKVIPRPVRSGVGNFLDNLGYANVILNDLLQGKFEQGLRDAGRMAVNSTVGIAGVVDVATNWGLPAHDNDLGMTLGRWGVDAGPYLVLPLLGPSTARDAPDIVVSRLTNPLYYLDVKPEISIPLDVLGVLNARSRAAGAIRFRDEAAIDPYVFTREAYLQRRRFLIEGQAPPAADDFYDDEFYEADPSPTTRP